MGPEWILRCKVWGNLAICGLATSSSLASLFERAGRFGADQPQLVLLVDPGEQKRRRVVGLCD